MATASIQNQDGRTMYFKLGDIRALWSPWKMEWHFEDYCLGNSSKADEPNRIGDVQECFVLGEDELDGSGRWTDSKAVP